MDKVGAMGGSRPLVGGESESFAIVVVLGNNRLSSLQQCADIVLPFHEFRPNADCSKQIGRKVSL